MKVNNKKKLFQTYIKSLQNPSNLNNILSDYCTLDYFGKRIYGKEAVSSHLMKYLQGSNYELSSFKVNNQPSNWEPISHVSANGFLLIFFLIGIWG